MQFNTYIFILFFMPLQVIAYFLLNKLHTQLGKVALIIGSLIFYAYADLSILTVLMASVVINYLFSQAITRLPWRRIFLCIPIVINISLLFYFKYTNFAISNVNLWFNYEIELKDIVQPLGISFFTFQQIAYIVSVYKKVIGTSLLDYLAYILYFPKILMGPLMEPEDFYEQINDNKRKQFDWDNLAFGIKIFSFGLFKKILLADTFAQAVAWGYGNLGVATSMDWILVTLFYTLQIYFDFSGYSDMAVGASLMLNIHLPINFDSPYKAVSIRDFWKRWHVSLTKFFTKYIYIPLGGSRRGMLFTCVNTMIVFLISGIWHGANWTFVLWGILHGLFNVLDRILEDKKKTIFEPARWILTFAVINVLWLLFRSESIQQWKTIVKTICLLQDTTISAELIDIFSIVEQTFIINTFPFMNMMTAIRGCWMLLFTLGSLLVCFFPENNYRNLKRLSWVDMILAAGVFIWSFTCLSRESVFLYFNF